MVVAEKTKVYRGGTRSRLSGGGGSVKFAELESAVFAWVVGERQQRHRVTRKSIRAKAKALHAEFSLEEPFEASSGWCKNFFTRFQLATRVKTHQSAKLPADLIPKLTDFLLYLRSYFADHPTMQAGSVYAMDETAVWFDSVSARTVDFVGSRTVSLALTDHDKQNVTVALTAAADGTKRLPFVVFKGKGRTSEDKLLLARRDIQVAFSDNGWFNTDLTVDWLKRVVGAIAFGKRLLIWDSYRCHISDPVKRQRRQQNVDCAIIPGGCTGLIQGPDVCWNKPFKSSLREQYDEWLRTGDKTYTAAGNVRAITKTVLCDMIVAAWQSLSSDLIINSFVCCGQTRDVSPADISCFKDGRPAADGRGRLEELFALPPTSQAPADIAMLDELEQDALVLGEDGDAAAVQVSSSSSDECSDDQAE